MPESQSRRLAAILAADIAGYSALMGADEARTVRDLKGHQAVVLPMVGEFGGRIIDTAGDGILAEFPSVVNAVKCAVAIQSKMAERNRGIEPEHRMQFRIGINIGDVVFDEARIYGDGINVAARLEGIAEPGGICISRKVYEEIDGKLDIAWEDAGEQNLKNIARPVRVYRSKLARVAPGPSVPDKPSIAVLPFNNMSGDPEQEYFADGMAEEILTALSKCKSLFVIARNSSFIYKGRAVDVRQIGRELGVRYVLEGSVRRSGLRLRFAAQLIEADAGSHIWADRFDGELTDVFDLQDRITESVVAAIEPNLQDAEIERLRAKPTNNLDAYDLLLRAQQLEYEYTAESLLEAIKCSMDAVRIDPGYAPAMALAAYCYGERRFQGWTKDVAFETNEGLRLARRSIELSRDDANVLWMAALAIWQIGSDIHQAKELAHRSLLLNPNSAIACTIAGWVEAYSGNFDKGLELLRRSQRLSPRDPRSWFNSAGMALAFLGKGEFEDGATWAKKALSQNPQYTVAMRLVAANAAHLGDEKLGHEQVRAMLSIEPQLTLASLRSRLSYMHDTLWNQLSTGLALAGLPNS
jgi:TolB-like protein/class 3 adenylate cyclase